MKYYSDFSYSDPKEAQFPDSPTNLAEALGAVILNFNDLDNQLAVSIGYLLQKGDRIGQIVTAELSFKNKLNLLASLFRECAPKSEEFDRLGEIVTLCFTVEKLRNQIIHSSWKQDPSSSVTFRSKYTARHKVGLREQREDLTPAQVGEIAVHSGYVIFLLDEFMYLEFGEDYGDS